MALKPPVLCKLKKGVILDAQSGFVDTFNWMVDFINNLKGEGEVDAGMSDLRVDRSVTDHPILRGGPISTNAENPVPWDLKIENGELYVFSPIAYVLTANGKEKSQQKLIVDGAIEGEWSKLMKLENTVSCIICAEVSGSGSISYSIRTEVSHLDGFVLFSQAIGTYARSSGSSGPIDSVTQLHHGAPTINGLGIADAASIFLNENGETEIKGFKSQADETDKLAGLLSRGDSEYEYAGSVLVRTTDENGKHELKFIPIGKGIGGGGSGEKIALNFIGTDGNSVTVGSENPDITRDVTFVSENDSNITVNCASDGNDGVKISIGVYYK